MVVWPREAGTIAMKKLMTAATGVLPTAGMMRSTISRAAKKQVLQTMLGLIEVARPRAVAF